MNRFSPSRLTNPAKFEEMLRPLWAAYVDRIPGLYYGRAPEPRFSSEGGYVEIQRGWGVSCSLDVQLRYAGMSTEKAGSETYRVTRQSVEVTLSWSSTGRSVAKAAAAIALYREMMEAGAAIEAAFQQTEWGTATPIPAE